MVVVQVSTYDIKGGAARAAYRLHGGLRHCGVSSSMFVRSKDAQDDTVEEWDPQCSMVDRLKRRVKGQWLTYRRNRYCDTRPSGLEVFSQACTSDGDLVPRDLPDADIYNLHWIRNFVDPLPFFRAVDQPVVWTLHDMNAFTGGCHYNVGCRRFELTCGACPQLGSTTDDDLSRSVWNRKRRAYRQALASGQLHIVAPSTWLAEEVRVSRLLSEAPVHVIPNGLDASTFFPRPAEGVRSALHIADEHRLVLFVAESTRNRRKGLEMLYKATEALNRQDVTLVSIGGYAPSLNGATAHVHLGRIESDLLLSVFYSMADVFVIPSRQDNLPNTVLEAMACGTPVVGFDVGGIPEMVRSGETGWLVESGGVRALRDTITQALSDDGRLEEMGETCRRVVEDEYTLQVQAQAYIDLYNDLHDPGSNGR